jgi:formate-dependent nitrite reductase membrane component NrfD
MVPDATFTSYYGRPVVKASPWKNDIPAYLFLGGLAAGSSLLAAGADFTGRSGLRRVSRIGALVGITAGTAALIHDLGKPRRFLNMLRVAKPTSPMSVGTWILTIYGPAAGLAGTAELAKFLPRRLGALTSVVGFGARPAGLLAAALAPALAAYTGVLLSDTATPAWHEAHRELPYLFVGSAAAAAGGLGMLGAPVGEAGPARRMAIAGAVLELAMEQKMERSMGITAQTLSMGKAKGLMQASKALTVSGALGTLLFGTRNRELARLSGAALLVGSLCTRFGVFEAGQESARDPRYSVVLQRERLDRRAASDTEAQAVSQAARLVCGACASPRPPAR